MTGRPEIELVSWVVTDDSTATITHPTHCWAWWEAVARLERTRQLAGHDYGGSSPTRDELWSQVSACHLVSLGVWR